MRIRDALESDAERLSELAGRPTDVMVDLVHDRSVRVAVEVDGDGDGSGNVESETDDENFGTDDAEADESHDRVAGFVAFDARADTVHVTDFAGPEVVAGELLDEPQRFAAREGMDVEVVVADDDEHGVRVVEAAGFDPVAPGPRFEGRPTTRFRLEPKGSE